MTPKSQLHGRLSGLVLTHQNDMDNFFIAVLKLIDDNVFSSEVLLLITASAESYLLDSELSNDILANCYNAVFCNSQSSKEQKVQAHQGLEELKNRLEDSDEDVCIIS